jgi:murein DD-endopeptidase MepM/ murein hydrolase activator NlpD
MIIRSNLQLPRVSDDWLDGVSNSDTAASSQGGPPAADTASGGVQTAQNSPLTTWPVPDHTELNERDPARHQGGGSFGAPRDGGRVHTGIDITAPVGSPVVAAGDGTVVNIQPNPSGTYGNQIVIEHPGGVYTQYGHLGRIDVAPGTAFHAGDVVGFSGRSGNVPDKADSHLHFEIRRGSMRPHSTGGQVVNPIDYLPGTP